MDGNRVKLRKPDISSEAILAYAIAGLPDSIYNSSFINNYFFDLEFDMKEKVIRFCDYYSMLCNDYIFEKRYDEFPLFGAKKVHRDLEQYIRKYLDENYFIIINWREDVIFNDVIYQNRGMLYAYDEITEKFQLAMCTKDGQWVTKEVLRNDICNWIIAGEIKKKEICFFELIRNNQDIEKLHFSYNNFVFTIFKLREKFEQVNILEYGEGPELYATIREWLYIMKKRIDFLHKRYGIESAQISWKIKDGIERLQKANVSVTEPAGTLLTLCKDVVELLYHQLGCGNQENNLVVFKKCMNTKGLLRKRQLKNIDPPIRTYLGDAFCHSIIGDIAFDSGWIFDKYIFLEYTKGDGQIKFADYDYYDFVHGEGVFVKGYASIPLAGCCYDKVISLVVELIDRGEYFFSFWDEGIIIKFLNPKANYYQNYHGCFVYGYDGINKNFLMHGYFDNIWRRIEIPFEVFFQAINSIIIQKQEFDFCSYTLIEHYNWIPNHSAIVEKLNQFISNSVEQKHSGSVYNLEGCKEYWGNVLTNLDNYIHFPSIYCMNEHNLIMQKRMEYMHSQGMITNHLEIIELLKELEKTFNMMAVSATYYNMAKKDSSVNKLRDKSRKQLELQIRVYDLIKRSIRY